jgi:LytS/YehU family sensor histidine kinase
MTVNRLTVGPLFWDLIYARSWLFQIMTGFLAYGALIGITLATESWRRERDRERREAALAIQAREAQLGAIRAQFQPHFVLNALNSLLALIDQEPARARAMVLRLADVMKEVFDRVDQPTVPLEREAELARAYLDVEQIRFPDRLSVAFDLPPEARHLEVPALLLQPIVENAVKHGIAPFPGPGHVRVAASVAGDRLVITVTDSGRPEGSTTGAGRGLSLTQRRLETLYGDGASLRMTHETSGTVVRIDLPCGPRER